MREADLDYSAAAVERWSELHAGRDLTRFEVGMRLRRLARTLQMRSEEELAVLGFSVYGDYELVSALRRSPGPLQPGEIAEQLMLTRAGVSGRLDRLEAVGLVEREQAARDGRAVNVRLTSSGRRAADKAFRVLVKTHDQLLSPINDHQTQTVSALLRVLGEALDQAPESLSQ